MSTLVTSNISDGTDTVGTEYVVNGSAKSWVNFNGTGTVAIRESFKVSSITDLGTGYYRVNFDTALTDANYSAVGVSADTQSYSGANFSTTLGVVSRSTDHCDVGTTYISSGLFPRDSFEVSLAVFR